jgi:hypothetical protein
MVKYMQESCQVCGLYVVILVIVWAYLSWQRINPCYIQKLCLHQIKSGVNTKDHVILHQLERMLSASQPRTNPSQVIDLSHRQE